jgi:hypothetical protein
MMMDKIVELSDKIESDELTDDDKLKLHKILEQVRKQREMKCVNSKKYYDRIKEDEEIMFNIRKQKHDYYVNNRDIINEKDRDKYHSNSEFKERKKEQSRINYHKKNDDVPKMKRGRKKKEKDPDEPPIVVKPRGRPKIVKNIDVN